MGNHHGAPHQRRSSADNSPTESQQEGNGVTTKKALSRAASVAKDDHHSQLLPIVKLTKILAEKSQKEEGINGVSLKVFTRCLFPRYPVLAEKLFNYFHTNGKSKNAFIPASMFKQQCEKFLGILDDEVIRDTLVSMWSSSGDNTLSPEAMTSLLMCSYHISMDHYSEGPQMCLGINKTLKAVVDGCFHGKGSLSAQFVSHWLAANTPRLLLPLHRYAVHSIATSWRVLEKDEINFAAGEANKVDENSGLELTTPVLEQPSPFAGKTPHPHLLTMSLSWLLAGALPPIYSRPHKAASPNSSGTGLSSASFLSRLVCAIPSHWTLLYDSDEMGSGANRFLHHVIAYKGPTLLLVRVAEGHKFCIAAPCEWKESHHYWGGEECAVFQLFPSFQVLERGAKMLYLNLSVRGYPQGLRAGSDPRAPIISIDAGFENIQYQKIPYRIETLEVWGCGDQVLRERQVDVKKWEVKEAERQRAVKMSAADWLDHPDRYLLELAGRPQYHQGGQN